MLYSLLEYLGTHFDLPGAGLFRYLSFRSVCAIVFALLIGAIFGKKIIERLRRHQIGEEIRNLGLEGQMEKRGTPTMGGLIILGAMFIPVILFCDLGNVYIQLMIVSSVWLGLLGFADDYIKVFRKHKEGLKGRFKIIGQVGLGIIVGTVMCFSRDIVIIEKSQPKATVVNGPGGQYGHGDRGGLHGDRIPRQRTAENDQDHHPLREEQRVRLPLARSDRQAVGRRTDMAHLHSDSHLHHHGGLQRRQSDRRARRARQRGYRPSSSSSWAPSPTSRAISSTPTT